METESIDRLFLELSQFTRATTAKELALQERDKQWEVKFQTNMDNWAAQSVEWQEERKKLEGFVADVKRLVGAWREQDGGGFGALWLSEIEKILEQDFPATP